MKKQKNRKFFHPDNFKNRIIMRKPKNQEKNVKINFRLREVLKTYKKLLNCTQLYKKIIEKIAFTSL